MPKIQLQPRSPEFANAKKRTGTKPCDMPGCREHGDFRAPKDRSLTDHYWFCQSHVADYNKAWDYFSGMPQEEVEKQILNSLYGDRPTWRYDVDGAMADNLRRKMWQTYHYTDEEPPKDGPRYRQPQEIRSTPEHESLMILGLEPPVDLAAIKTRYKELAKKYHPDLNQGDKEAEELLKAINMSYTILKLSYEKFEKLNAKTA
jgi:DnaJ domain